MALEHWQIDDDRRLLQLPGYADARALGGEDTGGVHPVQVPGTGHSFELLLRVHVTVPAGVFHQHVILGLLGLGQLKFHAWHVRRVVVKVRLVLVVLVHQHMLRSGGVAVAGDGPQGVGVGDGREGVPLVGVGFEKDLPVVPYDAAQPANCFQPRVYHGVDVLALNYHQQGFSAGAKHTVLAAAPGQCCFYRSRHCVPPVWESMQGLYTDGRGKGINETVCENRPR